MMLTSVSEKNCLLQSQHVQSYIQFHQTHLNEIWQFQNTLNWFWLLFHSRFFFENDLFHFLFERTVFQFTLLDLFLVKNNSKWESSKIKVQELQSKVNMKDTSVEGSMDFNEQLFSTEFLWKWFVILKGRVWKKTRKILSVVFLSHIWFLYMYRRLTVGLVTKRNLICYWITADSYKESQYHEKQINQANC